MRADTWYASIGFSLGLALKLRPLGLWESLPAEEVPEASQSAPGAWQLEVGVEWSRLWVQRTMALLQRVALDQYGPCLKSVMQSIKHGWNFRERDGSLTTTSSQIHVSIVKHVTLINDDRLFPADVPADELYNLIQLNIFSRITAHCHPNHDDKNYLEVSFYFSEQSLIRENEALLPGPKCFSENK